MYSFIIQSDIIVCRMKCIHLSFSQTLFVADEMYSFIIQSDIVVCMR